MKFFVHDNFPRVGAAILRAIESANEDKAEIETLEEAYGPALAASEWLKAVTSSPESNRPVIIALDDGIRTNQVSKGAMRDSGCNFVFLVPAWANLAWNVQLAKLILAWPGIKGAVDAARRANRKCRFDVAVNGKIASTELY